MAGEHHRFFKILIITIIITPLNLTFFDGGVFFDRNPNYSYLNNGVTMPLSFFTMLVMLFFSSISYKSFLNPILFFLAVYFIVSLVFFPFRISIVIFQIIYLILNIKFFENYFSNKEKVYFIENAAFSVVFLILAITLLSAMFIKPGYFLTRDFYIYDFEQYFSSIIVLLSTFFIYKRMGNYGLLFGISLGLLFYILSDSRLAVVMPIFLASYLLVYNLNLSSKVQIFFTILFSLSLYIFYLSTINNENWADSDRVYYIIKFFDNLKGYFFMFPVFSVEVNEVYSFHNEFIELYRVLGIFFIFLYLYLTGFIRKNIYGAISVAIIFFAANVVNMMLHLYTVPILAVFLVLSKRNQDAT